MIKISLCGLVVVALVASVANIYAVDDRCEIYGDNDKETDNKESDCMNFENNIPNSEYRDCGYDKFGIPDRDP